MKSAGRNLAESIQLFLHQLLGGVIGDARHLRFVGGDEGADAKRDGVKPKAIDTL